MPIERSVFDILLGSAGQDLAVCRALVDNATVSDAMFGFHAQQAVEKAIKAVLSANKIEFRRTHDLVTLPDLLDDNKLAPPPEAGRLDELNPYAVEARYGMLDFGGLDRANALRVAELVIEWASKAAS